VRQIYQAFQRTIVNFYWTLVIEVHKHLGPGLLESVYEACFIDELRNCGLDVKSQLYVPITYKGKDLGGSLKLDLLVNDLIIIED
jgi:GxxExxY protein